jgi:POT family proton-dependent oligopeptide transporter
VSQAGTITPADKPLSKGGFFGHPWGLAYLVGTQAWDSFSYYGMQSLLVLYMVRQLLTPGHVEQVLGLGPFKSALEAVYGPLSGQPLASAITGLYAALVWATPILGGLIADRFLGRTRTVILGCVLMTMGHFLMAFEPSFLMALLCLVIGTGCAACLKAQVGALYGQDDPRRGDAFQLYLLGLSVAVIFSPLVCGYLGEKVAWHWGFGAAGIGMLIGLGTYLSGRRHMPLEFIKARADRDHKRATLTPKEWRTVGLLVLLLPVFAFAAVGNMEIFNGYLIWGDQNFQLEFFGETMPVSWLLSMDAFVSVVCIALSMAFWRWFGRKWREPDEITKAGIGAAIAALAPLILAAASLDALGGHKVGLIWGLSFHIVNDIGFANVYPIGMALYSRAAPPSLGATVVNAYSLTLFLANLMVAKLAGLLSTLPATVFWTLHAGLVAGAAIVMLICAWAFRGALSRAEIA